MHQKFEATLAHLEREAEEKREEEEREQDLEGWAGRLRKEHEVIMNKIKERSEQWKRDCEKRRRTINLAVDW